MTVHSKGRDVWRNSSYTRLPYRDGSPTKSGVSHKLGVTNYAVDVMSPFSSYTTDGRVPVINGSAAGRSEVAWYSSNAPRLIGFIPVKATVNLGEYLHSFKGKLLYRIVSGYLQVASAAWDISESEDSFTKTYQVLVVDRRDPFRYFEAVEWHYEDVTASITVKSETWTQLQVVNLAYLNKDGSDLDTDLVKEQVVSFNTSTLEQLLDRQVSAVGLEAIRTGEHPGSFELNGASAPDLASRGYMPLDDYLGDQSFAKSEGVDVTVISYAKLYELLQTTEIGEYNLVYLFAAIGIKYMEGFTMFYAAQVDLDLGKEVKPAVTIDNLDGSIEKLPIEHGIRARLLSTAVEERIKPELFSRRYSQLNKQIEQVGLDIILGEGKETIGMIVGIVRTIWNVARDLKRGDIPAALMHLRNVASHRKQRKEGFLGQLSSVYLMLQFGLKPLLDDLRDILEYDLRYEGLFTTEVFFEIPFYGFNHTEFLESLQGVDNVYGLDQTLRVRESVVWQLDDPRQFILASLGLHQALRTIWELIPLSFIVDWFVDVKDFLTDTSHLTLGVKPVDAQVSLACRGLYEISRSDQAIQRDVTSMVRFKPDIISHGFFDFNTHGLSDILARLGGIKTGTGINADKAASVAAIIAQRFSK